MSRAIQYLDSVGRTPEQPVNAVLRTAHLQRIGLVLRGLGLDVEAIRHDDGSPYLEARCPGLHLKIISAANPIAADAMIRFAVADLKEAVATAVGNGAKLLSFGVDAQGRRGATLADPDGRKLAIYDAGSPPVDGTRLPSLVVDGALIGLADARAIEAVKRGAVVMLVGHGIQAIVAVPCMLMFLAHIVDKYRYTVILTHQKAQTVIVLAASVFLGGIVTLIGKLTCGLPTSSRVNYLGLFTASAIEITTILLLLISQIIQPMAILAGMAYLISLTTPLMVIAFLKNVMQLAGNETAIIHARRAFLVGALFTGAVICALVREAVERDSKLPTLIAVILGYVYVPIYFVYLYQVATTKTDGR